MVRAVSADDERENSADGGHAGDEPGDVVVDDAALEALDRDGQAAAGLVAAAEDGQAAPVEGGQGEQYGQDDRAEGDADRGRGDAGRRRPVKSHRAARMRAPQHRGGVAGLVLEADRRRLEAGRDPRY